MSKKNIAKEPLQVVAPHLNPKPAPSRHFTGSNYENFGNYLTNAAVNSLWLAHSDDADRTRKLEACLEAMAGIAPKDETEGMLAAQMIACHSAAMECFRRAMINEQPLEGRQQNLNFANKLTRTYALHMEALDKHRGKGQQKVTVEHVHVHQGGQAIVGTVSHGGAGGVNQNSEGQAHADAIAHTPEQEMRSPLAADGEAMPQRRDEERKV